MQRRTLIPRPPRSRTRDERGALTLETAVLMPVILLLVFTVVQGATWYYSRQIALNAAQTGVSAARVENGTNAAGSTAGRAFVTPAGGATVRPNGTGPTTPSGPQVPAVERGRPPGLLPKPARKVTPHGAAAPI